MDPALRETRVSDPAAELEELLLAMSRGIVPDPDVVTIAKAEAKGFVAFEIRAPEKTLAKISTRHREDIRGLMMAAATSRRTRVIMKFHSDGDVPVRAIDLDAEPDPVKELEDLLLLIGRSLVDNPDEVVVFPAAGDGFVHFEVCCDNNDVGAMLGRRASNAERIRTIIEAAGEVRQFRTSLHISGRDG